ncbi:MAG: nucleoside triphosphate pyrophosphohydrolase [Hyphomicrobiaceae bacterium]|nr:nucleoside triphosphate pyrophosphohydrolase [Hyphomicrobiaceae bacterium]
MTKTIESSRDIARLIEIMAALRTPVTGCPWDLAQNFETIAPYTLEEAYEVADAIERRDLDDLKDELGDLLLQVVYHARMGEEAGAFSFGDVVEGVTAKMIRRHPHVFGDETARSPGAVDGIWAKIKAEEKELKKKAGKAQTEHHSILADIPAALPGLTRAIKLQDKAARVGFDWPGLTPVFDKVREELAELEEVALPDASAPVANTARPAQTLEAIKEEFGDLLFVMANVARHLKIDPEAALRGANQKFIRRFTHIETRLAGEGRAPAQSTLEEMDALWDEAKALEKGKGTAAGS